jgi:hypothetical protein
VNPTPVPAIDRSGQAAIAVREALACGDAASALVGVPDLDEAHRIEILLGAAIRDCTDDHAAVRAWLAGDMSGLCERLSRPPDTRYDDVAVGLVVRHKVPEGWRPFGSGPNSRVASLEDVVAALAAGAGGLDLVAQLQDRLLHPAVLQYYRDGAIHALGVRPLLILASTRSA